MGDEVTLHYDSMLAKLIVWAPDRAQAIARMRRALDELTVLGVATNQGFHRRLLADPAFQEGDLDIQFLERRARSEPAGRVARRRPAAGRRRGAGGGSRAPHPATCGLGGRRAATAAWLERARLEGLR